MPKAAQQKALTPKLVERIFADISEAEIVKMACDVVDIPSPTGEELAMAEYMRRTFADLDLNVTWQELEEGRANVVARWEGHGRGKNLMFNGHMDTSNTGKEPFLTGIGYKPHAIVRDGFIYGLGIYNMKGALVCYTHAVKALMQAGVKLSGDVIIGCVAGEIEKTQWGEYAGRHYRGYGAGTHYLVNHGVLPDMCILGEPTDMKLVLEHSGSMWVRLSTTGPYVHTAFAEGREGQNALRRMYDVLGEVLKFSEEWAKKTAFGGHRGIINLGSLRAGDPWRASRTPPSADLFLDVRVPPRMPMTEARHQLRDLVRSLQKRFPDHGIDFESYVSVPSASISQDHEMVKAVESCHKRVMGRAPEQDTVLWCSDASVMSRFGIPTLNYGPSSGPRDADGEKVAIRTLVDITKVYALAAAQICGVES